MSATNVRVINPKTPVNYDPSQLRYGYIDNTTNKIFVQDSGPVPAQLQLNPFPSPLIKQRSCVNRFFAGVCNFFSRVKKSEDELDHGINYQQLPPTATAMCYPPSQSLMHSLAIGSRGLDVARALSHYSDTEEDGEGEGEYIIYIPRVSRTLLNKKYLDPLRKASYDPIVIQPRSRRSWCSTPIDQQEASGLRRKRQVGSGSRFNSRPDTGETYVESLLRARREKYEDDLTKSKSYGDHSVDNNNNLKEDANPKELENSSSLMYLYIPVSRWKKEYWFHVAEKNINWAAIHERHRRFTRNRQRISEECTKKWQIYFTIWARRILIGGMKRRLANDKNNKSMACTSPNTLESRFHHIHWLGNTNKSNNTVGQYFDKEENAIVALKIFSGNPYLTDVENLDNKLMAIQEIRSLKSMKHRNIVKFLGYFELHDKYHLILEACDHTLRKDIEEAPSGVGTSTSKKILKCILTGLSYCHQMNCLHRDLCPENILVCPHGTVKIADFDRSVFLSDDGVGATSPTPGSYVYNSPEILAGDKEYGLPSDIWSLGIIFCELLTGKPPWEGRSSQSQLREVHNSLGPLLPRHASVAKLHEDERTHNIQNHAQLQQMFTTISTSCSAFIKKCLDVDPQSRSTCRELLQHPFIKGSFK